MSKDFTKHDENIKKYATPSSDHLFMIQDSLIVFKETQTKIRHNFFANEKFYTKRERLYIHTTVAFLSMQVRATDKDDCRKLVSMMS